MQTTQVSAARRVLAGVTAVALGSGLVLASTVPNLVLSDNLLLDTVVRKAGHFLAYLVLSFLGCMTLDGLLPARRGALFVVLAALLVAVTDELRQLDVAGRIASPIDVSIDIGGAIAGVATYYRVRRSGTPRDPPRCRV